MALSTPTTEFAGIQNFTGGNTFESSSFTLGAGDLVAVVVIGAGSSSADVTDLAISDGLDVGTWTEHQTLSGSNDVGYRLSIFTAQANSGTTGTVTITGTHVAGMFCFAMAIYSFTGHSTSTPITQSAQNSNEATSTLTVTLGASPAATSLVLGGVGNQDGGAVTPGTDFTELHDQITTTGALEMRLQTQYDITNADTTCDWSGLSTTSGTENLGVAAEIAEAGGGGGRTTRNTRAFPLGMAIGMNWVHPGDCS